MYTPRIRKPEKALTHAMETFAKDPSAACDKLARLGSQEGYEYIEDALKALSEVYPQHRKIITALREPEWHWRASEDEDKKIFGFLEDDEFVPAGCLTAYTSSTGELTLFIKPPEGLKAVGEDIEDPRSVVKPKHTLRLHRRIGKRYFIVKTGTVDDLRVAGFSNKRIRRTRGKGYLKRFEAYVTIAGPIKDVEVAREELEKLRNM